MLATHNLNTKVARNFSIALQVKEQAQRILPISITREERVHKCVPKIYPQVLYLWGNLEFTLDQFFEIRSYL